MTLWDRFKAFFDDSPPLGRKTRPAHGPVERSLVRKRQRLMDGFISSEKMLQPRPCTVCDMTPLGGKVELWNPDIKRSLLGDKLTLYIVGHRKEVDCTIMWRKDNAMGLRFMSPFRAPTRRYG